MMSHGTETIAPGIGAIAPASLVSAKERRRLRLLWVLRVLGAAAALLLILAAVTTPGFLTLSNARAILASSTFVGMVAVGMTLIMISGAFVSLSLATTTTVTAMFFVYSTQWGLAPAILTTLVLGALIGLVQGLLIGAWAVNPIILTIAAGGIQAGVAVIVSNGATVTPSNSSYEVLNATPLGVPLGFYLLVALVILVELFMRRTRFGRRIYLSGASRPAARASAYRLGAIGATVFGIAGASAALAGIMLGAFNHSASLLMERGTLNYDAIAAVLVGGAAIAGGRGSVWLSLVGAVVIAGATDILLLRGFDTGIQILFKGLIVVGFVIALHIKSGEGRA